MRTIETSIRDSHYVGGFRLQRCICLAVVMVMAGLVSGCNTSDFIHKVNVLLAAPNFNLQRLRSIETNQKALTQLDRVDLAIGLDTHRLQSLVAGLPKQQKIVEGLAKQGLSIIGTPSLVTLPGALQVQVSLHKTLQQGSLTCDVDVDATGIAVVSGYENAALISLRFDTIALKSVQVHGSWLGRWFTNLDGLVPVANTTIRAVLPLLNDVVEREFNEKGASRIDLALPKIKSINLSKLSQAGGLDLKDKSIDFNFSIAAVTVLVEEHGALVMAKVNDNDPAPAPSGHSRRLAGYPPFDETQPTPSDVQVQAAFSTWKNAYMQRFTEAFGVDVPTPDRPPYVLIAKPFLARTLSRLLNTAPQVCGAMPIKANTPPFGEDLKFPNFGEAKCPGLLQSCTYKDVCANESQCESTVQEVVDKLCPGTIAENVCDNVVSHIPLLGDVLKKVCHVVNVPAQVACKVTETVTKPLDSPLCNGFRATKQVTPLLCNVASNTSKAACDAVTAPASLACQAEQTLRSVIDHNPFAHVDGNLSFNGNASACITSAQIDPGLHGASIRLNGNANGHADLALSYHNKIAPGVGLCTVDWAETFGEEVSTTIQNENIDFSIDSQPADKDGVLKIEFKSSEHDLKVDLSPSLIETVFVKHPQIVANCSVLLPAVAGYLAYDTVINQKLRGISPYASGKGVPLVMKPFGFSVAIASLKINLPSDELILQPNWNNGALAFN